MVLAGIASCSKESPVEPEPFAGREQRALLAEATELTLFAINDRAEPVFARYVGYTPEEGERW